MMKHQVFPRPYKNSKSWERQVTNFIRSFPDEVMLFAYRHELAKAKCNPDGPGLVNTYEQLRRVAEAYAVSSGDYDITADRAMTAVQLIFERDKENAGVMSRRDKEDLRERLKKI